MLPAMLRDWPVEVPVRKDSRGCPGNEDDAPATNGGHPGIEEKAKDLCAASDLGSRPGKPASLTG